MRDRGAEMVRERAAERAERAATAWDRHRAKGHGSYATQTPGGQVELVRVEGYGDGALEVWVGGATESGDPHFRVINPPTLVPDPEGDVEVRGKRYREDPLAALAWAIGSNGGAQSPRRMRRHGR